ncbi:hypothetical protein AAZX31_13G056000 [Glycine max]
MYTRNQTSYSYHSYPTPTLLYSLISLNHTVNFILVLLLFCLFLSLFRVSHFGITDGDIKKLVLFSFLINVYEKIYPNYCSKIIKESMQEQFFQWMMQLQLYTYTVFSVLSGSELLDVASTWGTFTETV